MNSSQASITKIVCLLLLAYFPNPNIATYTVSKFGVRGFYEALVNDLHIQGHGDYIHSSCIFPYYMNTTKSLEDHLRAVCKYRYTITAEQTAQHVIDAIVYNRETVMIPKIAEILFYM